MFNRVKCCCLTARVVHVVLSKRIRRKRFEKNRHVVSRVKRLVGLVRVEGVVLKRDADNGRRSENLRRGDGQQSQRGQRGQNEVVAEEKRTRVSVPRAQLRTLPGVVAAVQQQPAVDRPPGNDATNGRNIELRHSRFQTLRPTGEGRVPFDRRHYELFDGREIPSCRRERLCESDGNCRQSARFNR